jgi:hypothetical protein
MGSLGQKAALSANSWKGIWDNVAFLDRFSFSPCSIPISKFFGTFYCIYLLLANWLPTTVPLLLFRSKSSKAIVLVRDHVTSILAFFLYSQVVPVYLLQKGSSSPGRRPKSTVVCKLIDNFNRVVEAPRTNVCDVMWHKTGAGAHSYAYRSESGGAMHLVAGFGWGL